MTKLLILCTFLGLLSGCSLIPTIVAKKAEIDDSRIKGAKYCICEDCSIGSVRREFQGKESAYAEVCGRSPSTIEKLVK